MDWMKSLRSLRGGRLAIVVVALLLALLVFSRAAVSFWVDILWYREVGYLPIFLETLGWTWGLRAAVFLVTAGLFFVNLRVVARGLSNLQIRRRFGNLEIAERLPARTITWATIGLSTLLGLWFGAAIQEDIARSVLFQLASEPWGRADPFLGLDMSFYAFALPLLRAGLGFAMFVVFVAFTFVSAGYAMTGTLRFSEGGVVVSDGARRHMGVLVAGFLMLLGLRLAVSMPSLLLQGSSDVQGIFGYADHRARLRTLPFQSLVTAAAAGAVLVGAWRNRLIPVAVGIGATLLVTLGVGRAYPAFVQRFQVVPNELARESPYIEANLEHTRMGFGLDRLERVRYDALASGAVDWEGAAAQIRGLPVWTFPTLLTTFREVEARYAYYDFPTVAIDRYQGPDGRTTPVALAVREIDPAGIEEPNWQNLHIRGQYVAGRGAVAVDASGRTPEGRTRTFLAGLPPDTANGAPSALDLDRVYTFLGARAQPPYAIITPPTAGTASQDTAYMAPDGSPGEAAVDFPGGIAVSGLVRKLALAWYLREANVLFSSEVGAESRLVLHRGVVDRVRRIAPFLRFPEAPYPVVADGRIVWVLEGFSATRFYPLSSPSSLTPGRPFSYVRNSVKITIDGVTGETRFYALPGDDPLRDTYGRAFRGLFRPLEEMPEEIRAHLRYSRAMMQLQSNVLLQYHQETAPVFFGQQDQWAVPQELSQTTQPVAYRAEYGLLRMPGDEDERFRLVTSFVPEGRQNLTALLAGELEDDGRYRLRLFRVPVENQVPGPRQVEALVEQDPEISQQFSLWRTGGSNVWTGHLHLIPVGDRIVYMEAVFLAAEADAIPELRRFVVSDGRRVVMRETLSAALAALAGAEVAVPGEPEAAPDPGAVPTPAGLSRAALDLLDEAEARLRAGDYAGFGEALGRLRSLLSGGGDGAG